MLQQIIYYLVKPSAVQKDYKDSGG